MLFAQYLEIKLLERRNLWGSGKHVSDAQKNLRERMEKRIEKKRITYWMPVGISVFLT